MSKASAASQELELYKTLVGAVPQSMFILDKSRTIIGIFNVSLHTRTTPPVHDLEGRNLREFINNSSSPFHEGSILFDKVFDQVLSTGVSVNLEYTVLDTYLRATLAKISDERILIQIHNITQIVQKLHDLESSSYNELSMALTAGGLTSWHYDVATNMLSSTHNNNIIGDKVSFDELLIHRTLPEYREAVCKMFDDVIQGRKQQGEVTIQNVDLEGDLHWTTVHAIPQVYGADGKVTELVGSQKDVTREYEYNQEIEALNKQKELVMNNIKSGLVYITPDYRVIWENVSKVFKHPSIATYYRPNTYCYEAFHRDSPCDNCVMAAAMKSLKPESGEFCNEAGLSVEALANPLLDSNNNVKGVILRIDDVTQKNKVIKALKETQLEAAAANRLLYTILDNLPSSIFVKDVNDDFRYIVANKKYCETLSLSEKEIVGKTDYDLFAKIDADSYRHNDLVTIESNQPLILDGERMWLKSGLVIWHTIKTPLINDVDNKKLLIGIGVDITESHNAYQQLADAKKKAEESDRLKSAFLANMSHEIRTPLNAIVGFSELMQSCEDPEEKEEYMRIIAANNELLLRLINDILDLSKLESGIVEFHNTQFDLAPYFDELSATMRRRITNPNIEFIAVNPYKSCVIETDKARLTQVFHNFMTNAMKYTVSGHIKMGYEHVDDGIRLYVEDTGMGIPDSKKERVFRRFEKLDSFAQGTGLGLSICKAITEFGGGKVGFESTEGVGSLFWSWKPLPVTLVDKTDDEETSEAPVIPESVHFDIENYMKNHNCRILVAEDNDSNFLLIDHILKKYFQLFRAENGQQAVDFVKNNPVNLILMDIRMPIMDGLEATRAIREFNPNVPIIAITANAFDADKQQALNAGCNAFIAKPLRRLELLETMYRICRERSGAV
ncbi:MAG: response regulator [Alistipes sp.]